MTLQERLLNLVKGWRNKVKRCEDKYEASVPAQVQVARSALETCAEELEEEVRAGNQPEVKS